MNQKLKEFLEYTTAHRKPDRSELSVAIDTVLWWHLEKLGWQVGNRDELEAIRSDLEWTIHTYAVGSPEPEEKS
jgi:hypothetical protein